MTWPLMSVRTGGKGFSTGIPPEELTEKLVNSYAAQADDPDDGVVFWLALAAAQHETGRLSPDVQDDGTGDP